MVDSDKSQHYPKLWIYNYDFEFELAGQSVINLQQSGISPWHFLNRSAALFAPFANPNDAILCHELPDQHVLEKLNQQLGYLPSFIQLSEIKNESNSIFLDLQNNPPLKSDLNGFRLSPWGWSPKAVELNNKISNRKIEQGFNRNVRTLNSKSFSFYCRDQLLPDRFSIPTLNITDQTISTENLHRNLERFQRYHSLFFVKHYFGTSGKLSDECRSGPFSQRKIKKWKTWINKSGGILLEKKMPIVNEWSIQAIIMESGKCKPLVLSKLYCSKDNAYLGNVLSDSYSKQLTTLLPSINPVFEIISKTGYTGPVGIDLIETHPGQFLLLEINARFTMGRVAFEWHNAINRHPVGLFTNFFIKSQKLTDNQPFLIYCSNLEKKYGCLISIVNLIPVNQGGNFLATILIGGQFEREVWQILNVIKDALRRHFND